MKTIGIVDLTSGVVSERDRETLTLDVPTDLDRATGGISVDADKLGVYFAPGGERHVYATRPLQLSARAGEREFLVADEEIQAGGDRAVRRYRLSAIELPGDSVGTLDPA
jgi:hypothetical protein